MNISEQNYSIEIYEETMDAKEEIDE